MVTAQIDILEIVHLSFGHLAEINQSNSRAVGDGGTLKREMSN
jgi:hypothetical protein